MKKVIITIALVLIALIPTYVLVFQAMRTAVPDATLGDADIAPAFVRWRLQGKNSEVSQTSTDEDRANKRFGKAEPIRPKALRTRRPFVGRSRRNRSGSPFIT